MNGDDSSEGMSSGQICECVCMLACNLVKKRLQTVPDTRPPLLRRNS